MRKFAAVIVGATTLLAVTAFADATPLITSDTAAQAGRYIEAPFSEQDAAGIGLLTQIGAVEGNPDGTFAPAATLNRAAYLKIVLLSSPKLRIGASDAADCFPDVRKDDWFSPYVCTAKKRGMVEGYADGMFHQEQAVNYAESIKMLTEIFGLPEVPGAAQTPWYMPYAARAQEQSLGFVRDEAPGWGDSLTRAQMARLAASYRAWSAGELQRFRMLERGEQLPAVSSSSVWSSASSESSDTGSGSVSSSSQSSSVREHTLQPAVSHILLVGVAIPPIATVEYSPAETVVLRTFKARFDRELRGVESVSLVGPDEQTVATMRLDLYDPYDQTWLAQFDTGSTRQLPANPTTRLGVAIAFKDAQHGGFSQQYIHVRSMSADSSPVGDLTRHIDLGTATGPFPAHQTALASLLSVHVPIGALAVADRQKLELQRMTFTIERAPGAALQTPRIVSLRLRAEGGGIERILNPELRRSDTVVTHACTSPTEDPLTVNCSAIVSDLGVFPEGKDEVTISLYGSYKLKTPASVVEMQLDQEGTLTERGDITWNDGSQDFSWMDGEITK